MTKKTFTVQLTDDEIVVLLQLLDYESSLPDGFWNPDTNKITTYDSRGEKLVVDLSFYMRSRLANISIKDKINFNLINKY